MSATYCISESIFFLSFGKREIAVFVGVEINDQISFFSFINTTLLKTKEALVSFNSPVLRRQLAAVIWVLKQNL